MSCSQCQQAMTKTTVGWLCHNCGFAQIDAAGASQAAAPKLHVTSTPLPGAEPTANPALHTPPGLAIPESIEKTPVPSQPAPIAPPPPPPIPMSPVVSTPLPAPTSSLDSGWTDPTAKPQGRIPKAAIIIAAVALVLIGLGGGAYAYLWHQQPKQALSGYLAKLATAKTASYNGNISFDEPKAADQATSIGGALQKTSVSLSGAYDLNDSNNPKLKMNVKGSFGSQSVSGDLLVAEKALFFKIGSLGLLDSFGVTLSNDWYKISLDQSFNDNACYNKTKGKSGTILGQRLLTSLPTKDTKRVGLMSTVDGHRVSHYQGAIDFSKIQSYIDKANQSLPAECKLTYNAKDFKGLELSYDIYSGSNFDRIDIKAKDGTAGGTTHITMDTSGYNKPVDIKAPDGAKDIKDLFALFTEGSVDDESALEENTVLSRDSQRKSDLRAVKNALETYFNDVTGYPSGNYAGLTKLLVTAYIPEMPVDPTVGQNYTYTPSPKGCKNDACTSYVLQTTLENVKDSQIKSGTTNIYEVTSTN